jgi:hypothetical protein
MLILYIRILAQLLCRLRYPGSTDNFQKKVLLILHISRCIMNWHKMWGEGGAGGVAAYLNTVTMFCESILKEKKSSWHTFNILLLKFHQS